MVNTVATKLRPQVVDGNEEHVHRLGLGRIRLAKRGDYQCRQKEKSGHGSNIYVTARVVAGPEAKRLANLRQLGSNAVFEKNDVL